MNTARHKEIMSHAEAQFGPQWIALRDLHNSELREALFRAKQTGNSAAILPAEAACHVAHIKALIVAKAKCIAEAYTAFNEAAGSEAEGALALFFATTVAARKSSFQGEVALRRVRTRQSTTQLAPLLRRFDHDSEPALAVGRAILDRQRIEVQNKPVGVIKTKYVVDTCVFNWLTDNRIEREKLPSDGGFAITHIQIEEINKTKDEERRARLLLTQSSLHCKLLQTQTFVFDVSRFNHAKWGDGKLYLLLKAELDALNGSKKSNARDALIAEASIANGYTLLTADADLRTATAKHGGKVIYFEPPIRKRP